MAGDDDYVDPSAPPFVAAPLDSAKLNKAPQVQPAVRSQPAVPQQPKAHISQRPLSQPKAGPMPGVVPAALPAPPQPPTYKSAPPVPAGALPSAFGQPMPLPPASAALGQPRATSPTMRQQQQMMVSAPPALIGAARQEDPGVAAGAIQPYGIPALMPQTGGAIQPYGIPGMAPQPGDDALELTKRKILEGKLRVGVYNQKHQVEWKVLAVNQQRNTLMISDDDGSGNASFKISDMQSIQQGVHSSIVDPPPPADRVVAFQFGDGTLCVLFDNADNCQMALKALKQICQVPVYS